MQIKDIVNRSIVNLTNCEQEPIHIPGTIQEHGFLLALKTDEQIVEFCSGNLEKFTGITYSQALGKRFSELFGEPSSVSLSDFLTKHLKSAELWELYYNEQFFSCNIHQFNGYIFLEAQPVNEPSKQFSDVYSQTRLFLSYMEASNTLQELCAKVAANIRNITGYDRVMIYRFDAEYNGEVYAESRRDDLEPFLGLHYPHTDIPAQARELYLKNLVRIITDMNYSPVPIYTIDDSPDKNLDLSYSILRSVSPIHVQYLQNMGVGATLTISLVHNQKLWGLIACHHYSPKNISFEVKIAAQLQGHFITSQIDTRKQNEEYELARKCNEALEKSIAATNISAYDSFRSIAANPELLKLCNATGVALLVNGFLYMGGKTPDESQIRKIFRRFSDEAKYAEFFSSELNKFYPEFEHICEHSAGIIFHALSADYSNCIIWFRPQTLSEVHWAGDPAKAIIKDEKGLSPRNSFKLWKEVVRCKSKPWLQPERNAAARYAQSLQKQVNLLIITEEEKKYRELSELLLQTNAELENINWISAHDLQEPLRKIQLFASHLLYKNKDLNESTPVIEKISSAAARMQNQLKDILKYTRVKYSDTPPERIDLEKLLFEIKKEIQDSQDGKLFDITISAMPEIPGIPFLVKQVFVNLLNNSIKFAAGTRALKINITYKGLTEFPLSPNKELYHLILVSDNGIGFDSEYGESIFKVFSRLHSHSEYEGSGIGLALCRKIMNTHQGFITAEGSADAGAVFSLYFPTFNVER
ncbi:ATP-binding protein [Pollutibacter soli]|uniref:ATP-binding protein n=1 Tax=Pollutibacter soli TaxID=3034157 RepID=UPI003013EB01